MRVLKWVGIIVGAFVALGLVGALVIVWFVDANRFKPRIEAAVREATGRDFALSGDIELGFFPWLALRAGEGRFGNAPGFGAEPMVTWKQAQLGAKLFPLLRGELIADRIRLKGVELRLIRRADGQANWENIGGKQPADPQAPAPQLRIDGVRIEDSHLLFIDETVPRRVEITALFLTTDEIARGEPLTDTELAGVLHMDGFAVAGVPFKLVVPKVEMPEDFSALEVKQYEIAFGDFAAEGAVAGTLGDKPALQGALETNKFDLRALLTAVGIEAPKTTDPQALTALAAKASWSFEAGAIGIKLLAVTLDDTHLTGSFARGGGENPLGTFDLHGDAIDLARYLPPPDPASEPFVLPTDALKALKFRGVLELGEAKMDDIVMKGVTLRLLLDEQGLRSVAANGEPPR